MTSPCFKLLTPNMIITHIGVCKVGVEVLATKVMTTKSGHGLPNPDDLMFEGILEQDRLLSAGADRH
jgi:hypothetical protein